MLSAETPAEGTLTFTATAGERAVRMTLSREGDDLLLTDDASSRVLASAPAASTRRVIIRGAEGAHDDTLTVQLSGLELPGGVDFDAGAGGRDALVIGSNADVTRGSRHAGVLDFDSVQIRYENLEP